MKVLITGGNGYIGKSLYNYFKDNFDVTIIKRTDLDLRNSFNVASFFENKFFDVVIHCASSGGSRLKNDNVNVLDDNLKMYYNLMDNHIHFHKFINFSSGAEDNKDINYYGLSKSVIRKSIENKEGFYDIKIYAVFDENELETRFIKSNILRYIKYESLQIYNNKFMSFFYMKDLIRLVEHIIINPDESLMKYNYASYINNLTLLDIAKIINELDDYRVNILVGEKTEDDYVSKFNAGYGLKYINLEKAISEVYEKLKKK